MDLIFAPYETYLDDLLGVKASYGASILIRDDAGSQKVAVFQKYIPQLQDALPLPPQDRPTKAGHVTPMEVADAPFRAGDLRHGYQGRSRQPAERSLEFIRRKDEEDFLQRIFSMPASTTSCCRLRKS